MFCSAACKKAIGTVRVRQAVAGDGIEGRGDVGALEPRQRDVQDGIFLSLGGEIIHFEHIAVPFHDDRLSVYARDVFTCHSGSRKLHRKQLHTNAAAIKSLLL